MPLLLDRRSFLQRSLGTVALAACSGQIRAKEKQTRIALLSDTHIAENPEDTFRGFSPHANLKKVVGDVGETQFDLGIVNGDLARSTGGPGDYSAFASLTAPLLDRLPVAMTLGNHHARQN